MLGCDILWFTLITMHISHCRRFFDIHIPQGSVATYLRCGGIFKYEFVANLPLSLSVKEFWKSVNIWGSYGQEFSVLFFLTHGVETTNRKCYMADPVVPFTMTLNDLGGHSPVSSMLYAVHAVVWTDWAGFYRAMLCIRGTSYGPVPVCVCVGLCPSVTSRSSTKTAKPRITQTRPHDSRGTLVFWCQRSPRNSTGVTPYEGDKCMCCGSKSATFDK